MLPVSHGSPFSGVTRAQVVHGPEISDDRKLNFLTCRASQTTDRVVLGADKPGSRAKNQQAFSKTGACIDHPALGSMQTTTMKSPAPL
jgi:hypothetical protein